MNDQPPLSVRSVYPSLERFGVAVSHYPTFVQTEPNLHRIDTLLVSFVTRGRARHHIDGAEFEVTAGSVGITRPGEAHTLVTTPEGIEIYNLFLDTARHPLPPPPVELRPTWGILFPQDNNFRTLLNRAIHFQLSDPTPLSSCLELLAKECQLLDPGSVEIIRALQQVFTLSCCRAARRSGIAPALMPGQAPPRWVLNLCSYMDEHSAEPITLNDLCGRCRLSRGYLCRTFKKHVGVTTNTYLLNRRIESAMQALRANKDTVLSVALASGFNDLSHFNRCFKTRTGLTPTAYRNERECE